MNTPAARVWTEQLLFRGTFAPLPRSSATCQSRPFLRTFSSSARPIARSPLSTQSFKQNALLFLRGERSTLTGRFRSVRFKSDKQSIQRPNPDPTPHLGSPEPAVSLTQRLKKLSREYGWLALGVYMGLTVLDFPFCFLTVRMLGTDRIGHYEHVIIESVKNVLRIPFPNLGKQPNPAGSPPTDGAPETTGEGVLGYGGDVDEILAQNNGAEASIWTQLALAYAIHKSLIFFRIPLTAALLPKVAKTLRGWGYQVGKVKPK